MVASSRHRFCSVSPVRLITVTSSTMSYWCTVTYASAYTGSASPAQNKAQILFCCCFYAGGHASVKKRKI